jgi:hypothetical protein
MNLSFSEVVVLANAGKPVDRAMLARRAAGLYSSVKYGQSTAMADIKTLEQRGFLRCDLVTKLLEITREGWTELLLAIPILEDLRAAVAMVPHPLYRRPR